MLPKSTEDSKSILAELVLPSQANPAGNVHGGEIIKLMDNCAGVAAQKHCRNNVVTARVDELKFRLPVLVGSLVTCQAQVIYTGSTSMEVFVTVEAEDLMRENGPQIALTAFFTMVALDESGRPTPVAPIATEAMSAYDKKLYEEGKKRYLSHKAHRHS